MTQSMQPVPQKVFQVAVAHQLGGLHAIYEPFSVLIILGVALGIIAADILLMLLILSLGYISAGLLIIVPVVVLIATGRALFTRNIRVYVFTYGLVNARSNQYDAIRWEQVEAVWQHQQRSSVAGGLIGGVLGAFYNSVFGNAFSVCRVDGKTFTFSKMLRRVSMLSDVVQGEVARAMLPRVIAAYDAGSTITFGALSISAQGISKGKTMLPWNQVTGASQSKLGIRIMRQGAKPVAWFSADVSEAPNLLVFVELVNYIVRERRF